MRTLFTYVGFVTVGMLMLLGIALPLGPMRAVAQPPLALTPSAEPPTLTPSAEPPSPTAPLPQRPTVPPTATPVETERPTLTPQPTASAAPDPGVADPLITKRANLDQAQVGDFVEFTLTVTNRGGAPATDVVVTDPLPAFLTLYNATTTRGLISVSGNTVTIQIGTVEPGEIITIVILTQVNTPVAPPDNLNTARLSTTSDTNDPSNDASSAALIVSAQPTAVPPTAVPPTAVPPTAVPPTAVPPTAVPAVPTQVAAPAVLPPTGAESSALSLLILPLLLLTLGAALVGAVVRRRSVR